MRSIITTLALLLALLVNAQGPVSLGLKQALDMAATQSYAVQASTLEAEKAEAKIKEDTQATIRCVPFEFEQTPGVDMVSGKPAKCRVLIARSY